MILYLKVMSWNTWDYLNCFFIQESFVVMIQKKKVPTMNRQKYVFRNSFSWGNFSGENQGGHHLHICVPRTALKKSLASYLCLAVKKTSGPTHQLGPQSSKHVSWWACKDNHLRKIWSGKEIINILSACDEMWGVVVVVVHFSLAPTVRGHMPDDSNQHEWIKA